MPVALDVDVGNDEPPRYRTYQGRAVAFDFDDMGGKLVVTNESIAPKFALFREYGPQTEHHCGDCLLGPMEQRRIRLVDLLPPPAPPPPQSAATGARRGGKR